MKVYRGSPTKNIIILVVTGDCYREGGQPIMQKNLHHSRTWISYQLLPPFLELVQGNPSSSSKTTNLPSTRGSPIHFQEIVGKNQE